MNIQKLYNEWLNFAKDDADVVGELNDISGDESQIYERFYKDLEFGTAGLRGIIGAGSNRMNIYTVRKATQGLASYLNKKYDSPSVAISYDSRIKSDLFAKEAASVLAANDIQVYITKELEPTPVLSFAVREHGCKAGIMITASHNPAEYNGYKCYGEDGCQMTDKNAGEVFAEIEKLDVFSDVNVCDFERAIEDGKIKYIEDKFYDDYVRNVKCQRINKDAFDESNLSVVYTPLNGAGNKLVRRVLDEVGVKSVSVVREQENPDGTFSTCPYPNPEIKEALHLAIKLAEKVCPDIVLATDPDSDRVGIATLVGDQYRLFTGNEVGILLTYYVLSCRKKQEKLCENSVVVKTIVTTPMIDAIAKDFDCEVHTVLTGFKYIGEQILLLEQKKEENRFVFGFEESYGYLVGTYVRDKDAVVASMLICEMAAYYKKQNKSLFDVLRDLYSKYGYYEARSTSFAFEGSAGMKKMQCIMNSLRENPMRFIAEMKVINIKDYLASVSVDVINDKSTKITLPKSNVISYELENGSMVIVRPSGTEPKIKLYVTAVGDDEKSALSLLNRLLSEMESFIK